MISRISGITNFTSKLVRNQYLDAAVDYAKNEVNQKYSNYDEANYIINFAKAIQKDGRSDIFEIRKVSVTKDEEYLKIYKNNKEIDSSWAMDNIDDGEVGLYVSRLIRDYEYSQGRGEKYNIPQFRRIQKLREEYLQVRNDHTKTEKEKESEKHRITEEIERVEMDKRPRLDVTITLSKIAKGIRLE